MDGRGGGSMAMISGSAAAAAAGAGGPVRPPAQVLSDLLDALETLMAEVKPAAGEIGASSSGLSSTHSDPA